MLTYSSEITISYTASLIPFINNLVSLSRQKMINKAQVTVKDQWVRKWRVGDTTIRDWDRYHVTAYP